MPVPADVVANSRDVILDAAEQMMAAIGYEKASISKIVRASGLPVGSLYHHFGSKAGLLAAVMERAHARFFATMPQQDDRTVSHEQRMRDYWTAAADSIVANLKYFHLDVDLARFRSEDAELGKIVQEGRAATERRLAAVITPFALDAGLTDPTELVDRLVSMTMTFTRGAVIDAGADVERLRSLMTDLHMVIHATILQAARAQSPAT